MFGQDVFDHLCLLLYCRELMVKVLDSVAEEAGLEDGCIEKVNFVSIAHLHQVHPKMALLDYHCRHSCDLRQRATLVVMRSSCINPASGLPLCCFFLFFLSVDYRRILL